MKAKQGDDDRFGNRLKELETQIEALREKAARLSGWESELRALDDFAVEEKVEAFDELYNHAHGYVALAVKNGFHPKSGEYYLYEAVMDKTLGPSVWEILRTACD